MKRYLLLLFLFWATAIHANVEPIVFYAILTPGNETHQLHHHTDKEISHPYFPEHKGKMPKARDHSKAIGSATILFNPSNYTIQYAIAFSGLSTPAVMLHFHLGYANEEGPILETIFGQPYRNMRGLTWSEPPSESDTSKMAPKGPFGFIEGEFQIPPMPHIKGKPTRDQIREAFLKGGIYINIHTHLNEHGELRGQVLPLSSIQR